MAGSQGLTGGAATKSFSAGSARKYGKIADMRLMRRILLALCLGSTVAFACGRAELVEEAEGWPSGLPRPQDVAEAERLKQVGTSWSNRQIRQLYRERVATIADEDSRWRAAGVPAEERATRAFQIRREARLTARAMMHEAAEVKLLQDRDREKYGDPDGPTLEWLIEKAKAKGLTGAAIYESIVESAQRSNASVDRELGL